MKIDNEFTVGVPVERAWEVLTDLEAIAPCMPGAQLTGVEDEVYTGKIKVKVGPVVAQYAGTARFLEKDAVNHRAVIDAKGRDSRGAGTASAAITAHLRADGDHTVVTVNTDLKISGKIAQLGSGMIKEVSTKLLAQFVTCLESKLTTPAGPADGAAVSVSAEDAAALAAADSATAPVAESSPARDDAAVPTAAQDGGGVASADARAAGAGGRRVIDDDEVEPLDVMSVAGGSVYKRVIPLVVGIVVVIVAVIVVWTLVT
ncbi:SRPBCC family protein [Nonomuraea cavernae]|uniref:Carbon monoxide dehydrogenase subunit G (CoxG) family protein n=1 Tax=Nonomuraea cavernae TaxID=2045107 RepID=A0A918DFI4_9ACTN|nr:SRPBCC family protein [Nonomuraea cavernae]MCA2183780.1 SRPBCC family protein [Nonomuraea cavernae]GGO61342.1 carbon monoxide dehydrogenase subunit G (CoxG) family protein [Nonomuraea cavernae]